MSYSVKQFYDFYGSDIGQNVRDIIARRIATRWPEIQGETVLGCGYSVPYLDGFGRGKGNRILTMMPAYQGAVFHGVTQPCKNTVFLSHSNSLPLEAVSVDRAVLVHYVENAHNLHAMLNEIWRVLKPNGVVMVIVPNRAGMWARAEWSPFGQGQPFSATQLHAVLGQHRLIPEHYEGALFMPPVRRSPLVLKMAQMFEYVGQSCLPFVAGLHCVEARKTVYARPSTPQSGSAVLSKTKKFLQPKPSVATSRHGYNHNEGRD